MKTKTIYTILLTSILIPVANIYALDVSASTSIQLNNPKMEVRQEVKADRMEMRNENMENKMQLRSEVKVKMTEMRDSMKEARTKSLEEAAKIRVVVKLDRIFDRLTFNVQKLTNVDAEITKRLATRTNTAAALSLQVTAKAALVKASLDVEAAKAAAIAEVKTTTGKEVLRNLVNSAEASVKVAGQEYKKVVNAMKDLPRVNVAASSTINN